jgi:hypothetical protein
MKRRLRIISALMSSGIIGMGAMAMAPAVNAATTRPAAGLNGRAIAAKTVIGGDWEGSYTCSQGLTGLDLRIIHSRHGDALRATFSFYPLPRNPTVPVGIYTMRGTYHSAHSASRIVLRGYRWVLHPAGYVMVGLSGRLSSGKLHGFVHGPSCTTFSLSKPKGHPSRSDVIATWKGSYLGCGQGVTGLRLVVRARGHAGNRLKATFNFHAVPSNPTVPSGSYAMTGYFFAGGVVLDGTHWIHQPSGYGIVNLVGTPPRPGGKKFRGVVVGCAGFSLRRT